MKILVLSTSLVLLSVLLMAQKIPCYYEDESGEEASLYKFMNQFRSIIEKKDASALYRVIEDSILNGFGGDYGIKGFKEKWKPEDKKSELWVILKRITSLGGVIRYSNRKLHFICPYVNECTAPYTEANDEYYYAVTGNSVNVRVLPDTSSKIITKLSYEWVKDAQLTAHEKKIPALENGFTYITGITGGFSGYVADRFLYGVLDTRMFITKQKNGGWKITVLTAGD
jgi:hypothetical protein